MTTRTVYLSLGSNVGDREHNLRCAVEHLSRTMTIDAVSSLYKTDPVGVTDQPGFLNVAVSVTTSADPYRLLTIIKDIELMVGRRPTFRWGPRVIDIDLVLMGDEIVDSDTLTIPHPEMTRRAFVLAPLAEIAPNVRHPVDGRTVGELLASVGSGGVCRVAPF